MATDQSASSRHWHGTACACGAIDVHCHVVPFSFPDYLAGLAPRDWPAMVAADGCRRTMVVDGRNYRTLDGAAWDAERRLEDMERMGIAVQALSPMPELFSYWMDAVSAAELLRYVNDTIAAMVEKSPSHFVGLGAVPLQDVGAAIAELQRLIGDHGFAGVEIGSNVNGAAVGDPRFLPFFAEAERLGAAVFVHAVRPAGMDRLVGPAQLQQVLAYPTDVGLAAASVLTGGLMRAHPKLRIAFSHGGGTLASLLPRLREGAKVFGPVADAVAGDPYAEARKLYVDSLVYDAPTLRHLATIFGTDRIVVGTDYPFNFHERAPLGRIEAAFEDPAVRARLTAENAAAFLGIEEH
ncbi:amidohydrolase family protein [Jiella sp. M17.18]|uniref:amidohydrolase family protein n=1 Tax=Jiella sp. M17.18 TaxID=3234247 RepID=UPI0034DE07ED